MAKTSVQPNVATTNSNPAYRHSGRAIRFFQRAAIVLPTAKPAMKLDKIKAADQTEFPNASPLNRNQSVSNRSALHPDKKRISEIRTTRMGGKIQRPTSNVQRARLNESEIALDDER